MNSDISNLTGKEKAAVITKSITYSNKKDPSSCYGRRNLDIIREELSELDIEISKAVRGKINRVGLLEEMADTVISLEYLKQIFHFNQEELDKAVSIKLMRENDRVDHDYKENVGNEIER